MNVEDWGCSNPVYHRLSQNRSDLSAFTHLSQFIIQNLLHEIANLSLALGATDIKGHSRNFLLGTLILNKDISHLRAITMGDDYLVPGCYDWGQLSRGSLKV